MGATDEAERELSDILRDLVRIPGVLAAAVGPAGAEPLDSRLEPALWTDARPHRVQLDPGGELLVLLERDDTALTEAVAKVGRALSSCLRRHAVTAGAVPEVSVVGRAARPKKALLARMARFLDAFGAAHGACGVALLRGTELVATGGTVDDIARDRLPFLRKRLDAEVARTRGKTSHAELAGDDVYACTFWFGAYLVTFFDRPYPVDFVRYRARAVARELALIMPHLEPDPPDPVQIRPRPTGPPR